MFKCNEESFRVFRLIISKTTQASFLQLVIFHKMIMMYCSHSFSHGFFIIILSAQIDTKDGTILVDYSKNIITDETMKLLMNLVC